MMFKNVADNFDEVYDENIYEDNDTRIVDFKTLNKSNMIKRAILIRQNYEKQLSDEKKQKEITEKEKIENLKYKSTVAPLLNWVNTNHVSKTFETENTDFPSLNIVKKNDTSWISVKVPTKIKQPVQESKPSYSKTKFCSFIMEKKECPRGDKCTYAHLKNELFINDCSYDNCKFVKFYNNNYHNTHKYYRCERRHKNESIANFFSRTGINDPVTEKEMQEAYDSFLYHYSLLTQEMINTIDKLPCDKVVIFNGFSFNGNGIPSYKQRIRQQYQRPFVKKIWTNFVNIVKSQPQQTVPQKTILEDPEKEYIRNKNNKNNEIRLLKISINRTQETIDRMKKNNSEFVKKYEKEYKEKMQYLVILEKELNEIKIEKRLPVIDEKIIEEKVEKIVRVHTPKKIEVLEIISNKKFIEIEKPKHDEKVERVVESKVERKSSIEKQVESNEGWTQVNVKRKSVESNEGWTQVNVKRKPPKENTRTQICRSLSENIKCPYGETCRYAHTKSELNIKSCGFGIDCKLIKIVSGKYMNINNRKLCCHIHPSESKSNFYSRNKLNK